MRFWSILSLCATLVTLATSSPKASMRCAMPTSLPLLPARRSASKTLSTFSPSLRTRFEVMPCSSGAAPRHRAGRRNRDRERDGEDHVDRARRGLRDLSVVDADLVVHLRHGLVAAG